MFDSFNGDLEIIVESHSHIQFWRELNQNVVHAKFFFDHFACPIFQKEKNYKKSRLNFSYQLINGKFIQFTQFNWGQNLR